jgi:hypothetical protein
MYTRGWKNVFGGTDNAVFVARSVPRQKSISVLWIRREYLWRNRSRLGEEEEKEKEEPKVGYMGRGCNGSWRLNIPSLLLLLLPPEQGAAISTSITEFMATIHSDM